MTAYTTEEIYEVEMRSVKEDLKEWKLLVDELSEKEIALYHWREVYNVKADEIIAETDFKALYGANNQKVRDNHVKQELSDWYDNIKSLEFSIEWIGRRISYLRHLVEWKTRLMEVK